MTKVVTANPLNDDWDCLILAAGRGSRMNSKLHKSLLRIYGKNLIEWGSELASKVINRAPNVLLGFNSDKILLKNPNLKVKWLVQEIPGKGTAGAVYDAINLNPNFKNNILVLYVDDAFLYSPLNIHNLCFEHQSKNNVMTILTFESKPLSVGGVLYDKRGIPKDTVSHDQAINMNIEKLGILCGAIAINKEWFQKNFSKIKMNLKGEYGLPELINIAYIQNSPIASYQLGEGSYWQGINTRQDLSRARYLKKKQLINK